MNFLKNIQDSIYSPKFYTTLLTKSFKESIGYFLLLILLLTVLNVITLIPTLLLDTPKVLNSFAENIINCFPKDLEFTITNGKASANISEPYFISSCEGDKKEKVAVIDTKTPFSLDKFNEYKVAAWITKDSIVYKKGSYETRTYTFNKVKDFKLNREVLNSYFKMASPYLKFVGPILLILSFIGIFLSYDFRLIYLLFLASIIWLFGKIFKQTMGYGQAYKVGLHAITLGLIVDSLVNLARPWTNFSGFPFMVSILTLGIVIVNIFLPKNTSS